jgi:hypothetical protein
MSAHRVFAGIVTAYKECLMKLVLSVLVAVLLLQSVYAGPSAPLTHSHAGRSHSHPLPATGVGHRHGNGAPGVIANQSGGISGSYTPGAVLPGTISGGYTPEPVVPPRQVQPLAAGQYATAYTHCRRADPDCNVCAVNVRQQFNRATSGMISWRSDSWRFDWDKNYPPQKARPIDVFKGDEEFLLGIPKTHVQGFVRTNSGRYPYAGTHSHKRQGGIFLVAPNKQSDKHLAALFKSQSRHPSGAHAFGKYLVYGENGRVFLKDLNRPAAKDISVKLPGPTPNFGGGVGLVKLQDGTYLLLTTGPGGQDERPRFNRFYQLRGRDGRMEQVRYLGQTNQVKPAQWPQGFRFAENLSMITECGSGDIYVIHATGDEDAIGALGGRGYWRLSQVEQQGNQLSLTPVSAFLNSQNLSGCSMRAAASVHVNPAGKLEFYCHGYAKNPKGSALNILGKSKNKFKFTVGIPR